jgi:hypothetical protein
MRHTPLSAYERETIIVFNDDDELATGPVWNRSEDKSVAAPEKSHCVHGATSPKATPHARANAGGSKSALEVNRSQISPTTV